MTFLMLGLEQRSSWGQSKSSPTGKTEAEPPFKATQSNQLSPPNWPCLKIEPPSLAAQQPSRHQKTFPASLGLLSYLSACIFHHLPLTCKGPSREPLWCPPGRAAGSLPPSSLGFSPFPMKRLGTICLLSGL